MIEYNKIFINGKWVAASSGEFSTLVNPATKEAFAPGAGIASAGCR